MPVRSLQRRRRCALPAAVLTAAALALTACTSSTSSTSSASSAPSVPSASSPASASTGPSGAAPSTATPSSAPSTAPSTASSGSVAPAGACSTGQLSVQQQDPGVAAGSYYSELVFTNTSGSTCTLSGYPGVSYVAENGVQSGNAADRAPGTVGTVTLKPGGTASAQFHDSNGISGYDPAQCQLSPAQGLRIYPPNQKDALFLPWKHDHCAGPTIHSLTIAPLQ